MRKLTQNSEGFTIVELLVAVGIMGLVAMAMINLSYFFEKSSRGVALRAEISYFDQKISHLLANADNCEATIGLNTVVPTSGKTDLTQVTTKNVVGVDQVTFLKDTTFNNATKLDNQIAINRGGDYPVWIESVFITGFNETDYAETSTTAGTKQDIKYSLFGTQNKYGWAKVVVIFVVRQVNGKTSGGDNRYIYRRAKAEYPVAVILDSTNRLKKCVDASTRTATSALDSLCVDLGGSVTFINGEPQCAGSIDVGLQKGRRFMCANFGGKIASKAVSGEIEYRNYDCVREEQMQHLDCVESKLIITNNMEFRCATPQGPSP